MNLQEFNINLFYDGFNEDNLWGYNLVDVFKDIYSKKCKYVVMFISKEYNQKAFSNLERQAALSKALYLDGYILPVRLDDENIKGQPETVHYLDARNLTPKEVATKIANKLRPFELIKSNLVTPPTNEEMQGIVEFNYTNNDGHFLLGKDLWLFETQWTAAGSNSIHVYNDGESITGVAIAESVYSINQITDATVLDYTSRTRSPNTGDVIVYKNKYGFFCAIKILDVKYKGREGATTYSLKIEYKINLNGFNFSDN